MWFGTKDIQIKTLMSWPYVLTRMAKKKIQKMKTLQFQLLVKTWHFHCWWECQKYTCSRKQFGREGEGDDRGWDGWMASPTRWRWVSVNSGSRWWTGRPGVLQFMGSQRVGHDWATELNWTELIVRKKETKMADSPY